MDENQTQSEDTTANQTGDTSTVTEGEKLFTQDEVNKVVSKRVKEVKSQFKDYEELKQSVESLQAKLKQLQDEQKQVQAKYTETVFTSMLETTAKELNLDPNLATKLLDREKIIVVDEKPSNLKELLQALIEEHPQLVKKAVVTPQVNQTQTDNKPKFSLYTNPNSSNFFAGGGLRLNHGKQES